MKFYWELRFSLTQSQTRGLDGGESLDTHPGCLSLEKETAVPIGQGDRMLPEPVRSPLLERKI
jgi:hypothetical protein